MVNLPRFRKICFVIGISIVAAIGPFLSAWGGYDEGMEAYKKKDYETALKELEPLAEQGENVEAQYMLGKMYLKGEGVPQDFVEAAMWIRKAAERGNPEAQNDLGKMYMAGSGVPPDHMWALIWFDLAAKHGKTSAIRSRDFVRRHMSSKIIKRAQHITKEWLKKNKKK